MPDKLITAWSSDGWINIRFVYDEDFILALKKGIHPQRRKWTKAKKDRNGKTVEQGYWSVDLAASEKLEAIALEQGYDFLTEGPESEPDTVADERDAYRQMFSRVPIKVLRKVYLSLSRAYHPDKNERDERSKYESLFADISGGWARIQDERKDEA